MEQSQKERETKWKDVNPIIVKFRKENIPIWLSYISSYTIHCTAYLGKTKLHSQPFLLFLCHLHCAASPLTWQNNKILHFKTLFCSHFVFEVRIIGVENKTGKRNKTFIIARPKLFQNTGKDVVNWYVCD